MRAKPVLEPTRLWIFLELSSGRHKLVSQRAFKNRYVMTEATNFVCPGCAARYKVVRVRAEPNLAEHLLHCLVCKGLLAAMDGDYALKYFLVDKGNSTTLVRRKRRYG